MESLAAINAIESRNLYYCYADGSSKLVALSNLSVTIPSGCIYCLIGPSGCGKTTYLRSLIGTIKPQAGSILLFGLPLGHRDLSIPGRHLGYMPQDVSLNDDLTIGEMISFFSRLYNTYSPDTGKSIQSDLKENELQQSGSVTEDQNATISISNYTDYLDYLSLPSERTLIGSLSGGQKRRVSFLCSLLHKPKLIILDEPTVGCDPLVTQSMWTLLKSITSAQKSTVIITTHYLEEARKTDLIGFMRKGLLLEQGTPCEVLNRLQVSSIETAFALLCEIHKKKRLNKNTNPDSVQSHPLHQVKKQSLSSVQVTTLNAQTGNSDPYKSDERSGPTKTYFRELWIDLIVYFQLTYAISHRLCLRLFKLKGFLLSSIIVIPFLISLTQVCVGGTPVVTIGLVDNNYEDNSSDLFLNRIDQTVIHLKSYKNREEAQADALTGPIAGYLTISPHLTHKVISQYTFADELGSQMDHSPPILYHGDTVSLLVLKTIMALLQSAFDESVPMFMNISNLNPGLASPFARIVDPLVKPEPTDLYNSYQFWIPKFLIFWSFVTVLMLSSYTFYRDRTEPLFERSLSSGLKLGHFMIGQCVASMILPLLNSWPVLMITIHLLGAPCRGPLLLAWFIYILNAASAMVTSFALASINIEIAFTFILVSAYTFSGMAMAGILWPPQALPYFIQPYSNLFPFAVNFKMMVRILSHGSSWTDHQIVQGIVTDVTYIVLVLIFIRIKLRL